MRSAEKDGRRGGIARAKSLSAAERSTIAKSAARARWLKGKRTLSFDREGIESFCKRWNVTQVEVFGSGARGDMRPDSDVDVMLSWAVMPLLNIGSFTSMKTELEGVFKRPVDLFTRESIESFWRNKPLRQRVLAEAKVIHAQA